MPSESVRLRVRPSAAAARVPGAPGVPGAPDRLAVTAAVTAGRADARPPAPVAGALRVVESLLLRGGQRTARRNAWAAVVADRQRARDRREAEYALATLLSGAPAERRGHAGRGDVAGD